MFHLRQRLPRLRPESVPEDHRPARIAARRVSLLVAALATLTSVTAAAQVGIGTVGLRPSAAENTTPYLSRQPAGPQVVTEPEATNQPTNVDASLRGGESAPHSEALAPRRRTPTTHQAPAPAAVPSVPSAPRRRPITERVDVDAGLPALPLPLPTPSPQDLSAYGICNTVAALLPLTCKIEVSRHSVSLQVGTAPRP